MSESDPNPFEPREPSPHTPEQEKAARVQRADDEFFTRVLDWDVWITAANDLLYAADVLGARVDEYWRTLKKRFDSGEAVTQEEWRDGRLIGGHQVLTAYAIENLLKALIVKRDNKSLARELFAAHQNRKAKREKKQDLGRKDALKLPLILGTHDLAELARRAGFVLNDIESGLIVRLAQEAVWSGRYGVPKTPKEYLERSTMQRGDDLATGREVIRRLRQAIEDAPAPWPNPLFWNSETGQPFGPVDRPLDSE